MTTTLTPHEQRTLDRSIRRWEAENPSVRLAFPDPGEVESRRRDAEARADKLERNLDALHNCVTAARLEFERTGRITPLESTDDHDADEQD